MTTKTKKRTIAGTMKREELNPDIVTITTPEDLQSGAELLAMKLSEFSLHQVDFPHPDDPLTIQRRTIGASVLTATVQRCITILERNPFNREIGWGEIQKHIEKMRASASDFSQAWFPMVSQLMVSLAFDPTTKAYTRWELSDGQHRLIAYVFAFGTMRDVQRVLFIIRKFSGVFEGKPIPDVSQVTSEDHIIPQTGDGKTVKACSFDEWFDFAVETYRHVSKDGKVTHDYRKDGFHGPATTDNDGFEPMPIRGFKFAGDVDEAGDYIPQKPGIPVTFSLVIGTDPRVKFHADGDQLKRTAENMLTMNPHTGSLLVSLGLDSKFTAQLLGQAKRRYAPVKTDADGNVTKRGTYKEGGRGLSPKSAPGQAVLHEAGIKRFAKIQNAALDKFASFGIDLKEGTGPLTKRVKECKKPISLQEIEGKRYVVGSALPSTPVDNWLFLACEATKDKKQYFTDAEIVAELVSMKFGIREDEEGNVEACNHYDMVRQYVKEAKSMKATPNPDALTCSLVRFSQMDEPDAVSFDYNDPDNRFPGRDMIGYTRQDYAVMKGKDPAQVGTGSGRRKGSTNRKKA